MVALLNCTQRQNKYTIQQTTENKMKKALLQENVQKNPMWKTKPREMMEKVAIVSELEKLSQVKQI